jgi:hypothetical protein
MTALKSTGYSEKHTETVTTIKLGIDDNIIVKELAKSLEIIK